MAYLSRDQIHTSDMDVIWGNGRCKPRRGEQNDGEGRNNHDCAFQKGRDYAESAGWTNVRSSKNSDNNIE